MFVLACLREPVDICAVETFSHMRFHTLDYEILTLMLTKYALTNYKCLQVQWLLDGRPFTGGSAMTVAFGDHDVNDLRHQTSMRLGFTAEDGLFGQYTCSSFNPELQQHMYSAPANVTFLCE